MFFFSLGYVARLIDESGVCVSRAWEVVWQHVRGGVEVGPSAVVAAADAVVEVGVEVDAVVAGAVVADAVVADAEEADSHPCMPEYLCT